MTFPQRHDIIDFIYHEARLLDECRYDEWLGLWTADGRYWMPLSPNQSDPILETSLLYEDLFMLRLRIERLKGIRTFSQQPESRCHHLVQRPFIDKIDPIGGQFATTTPMHYIETRRDEQFLLAITMKHNLVLGIGDALKIACKRVNIINCDAALGAIQLLP